MANGSDERRDRCSSNQHDNGQKNARYNHNQADKASKEARK